MNILFALQIYYELDDERRKVDAKDVAICRVEQLCPFPFNLVQRELKRYPSKFFQYCKIFSASFFFFFKWILISLFHVKIDQNIHFSFERYML